MDFNVVGICSNGLDAMKKCRETNPELVLMDIMLKGDLNGIETANNIKKIYKIPHIYLTAFYDKTMVERAKTTNPSSYINKPFDNTELKNAIYDAIR
jgi:DNA-binding NarL/FixJ family response regulator